MRVESRRKYVPEWSMAATFRIYKKSEGDGLSKRFPQWKTGVYNGRFYVFYRCHGRGCLEIQKVPASHVDNKGVIKRCYHCLKCNSYVGRAELKGWDPGYRDQIQGKNKKGTKS